MVHAAAFRRVLEAWQATNVLDLGSGGGVPGLVLAVDQPRFALTLVDANLRRTAFLTEAVAALGVAGRVTVVRARAEELGADAAWRGTQDAVVARGFGPPAVTAECAAPLLRLGGALIVSEPPDSTGDRWSAPGLEPLGLAAVGVVEQPRLMILEQRRLCPERFPRRAPGKRPLF